MAEAGLHLAARYWRGEGVARNAEKACYWLRRAALHLPAVLFAPQDMRTRMRPHMHV